jgi:endonuclease YncB( thermonuclease family)
MLSRVILGIVALAALGGYLGRQYLAGSVTVGQATVIDGDTLQVGSTRIRLFGIDAPEGRQTCDREGAPWPCGAAAAEMLESLVEHREIECHQRDVDNYERSVSVCMVGDVDIGAELVRAGLALAYRTFSTDYVDEEAEAKAAKRGMWAGDFTPPWEWRRNGRDAAARTPSERPDSRARPRREAAAPEDGCVIKGNISRSGAKIYHLPGSRGYDDTVIDESRGERMFCSEEEAIAAGWRPPQTSARN